MKRYFFLFQNDEFQSTVFFAALEKKRKSSLISNYKDLALNCK